MAKENCSRESLPICLVSAKALTKTTEEVMSVPITTGRVKKNKSDERKQLPNMRQEILRKAGMHEDFFNFLAADEAVKISVCFEEDVVIAPSVCDWYHPV